MKKRLLAFLLAVSMAVSMLALPAAAAGNANTAVQLSITLDGMDSTQTAALNAVVTRGAFARMLVAYSTFRESVGSQGAVGTLYKDLPGSSAYAPYVRIAVQQGWMSGYTDGTFRPDNAVTLEEAVTAVLKLLGYKMTDLSGSFPQAQLNKASELGLRNQLERQQGEALNYEECAILFYTALTANAASGSAYGTSLGFTVSNGQVDTSSVMLSSLKGPFIADGTTQLPFVPVSVYRNDKVSSSAELTKYDVYYYSESLQTVWIYTRRAAGRITAVSPSASAPTSVTVAGSTYTLGSAAVASQVSSLNGGGVGQVVTLLLGMNNEAAGIVTGEEADSVFYGVVQSSARSLIEENGADVLQKVAVLCTDGITRTVNVDKSLNFPTGWLVKITVNADGENVETLSGQSVSGTIRADGTALGDAALASDVEILDTTAEGLAGTVSPSRLSGVTLSASDVRYYTVDENGAIDRLILNDATGDLWTYGVLDDVTNLISTAASSTTNTGSGSSTSNTTGSSASDLVAGAVESVMPSTSTLLYGLVDGSIGSTLWESVTSSTASLASYLLKIGANSTTGVVSSVLDYLSSGANYVCYVNGEQTTYKTSVKYPVLAGGISVRKTASGSVGTMAQLLPVTVDQLGAASVRSGSTRYETADDMQVYLWYKGKYYATTLSQINAEDYSLIGWYDAHGSAAGGKIRVLVAVKKD